MVAAASETPLAAGSKADVFSSAGGTISGGSLGLHGVKPVSMWPNLKGSTAAHNMKRYGTGSHETTTHAWGEVLAAASWRLCLQARRSLSQAFPSLTFVAPDMGMSQIDHGQHMQREARPPLALRTTHVWLRGKHYTLLTFTFVPATSLPSSPFTAFDASWSSAAQDSMHTAVCFSHRR